MSVLERVGCRCSVLVLAALVAGWPMPAAARQASPGTEAAHPTIVAIRVHGNHTTPDADVRQIAGLAVGAPFDEGLPAEVEDRLRHSQRFRRVEVRKRYGSIANPDDIVLVILVEELAGISVDVPTPGPARRVLASTMWMPVLGFEDGYGVTYGARISFVDLLGPQTRLSVPLTWGGERRAAVELERTFERGPLTRVLATGGVWRRENPAFEVGDRRRGVTLLAERSVASWVHVGATGTLTSVGFDDLEQRVGSAGIEAVVDTRRNPAFPRHAVHAAVAVERLWFDVEPDTHRTRMDLRGYVGLAGQSVFLLRAQHHRAGGPLPRYEQFLLGGSASVRGFDAGHRAGDRLAAATAELRVPISSPLSVGRAGVAVFVDTGAVYRASQSVRRARFDEGVGAGFFVHAPLFAFRLDVARGIGSGTRAHVTIGTTF